jgi:hypothetical protein
MRFADQSIEIWNMRPSGSAMGSRRAPSGPRKWSEVLLSIWQSTPAHPSATRWMPLDKEPRRSVVVGR